MNKITLDLTHLRPLTLNKYHLNGIKIDERIARVHRLNIGENNDTAKGSRNED